MLTVRQEYLLQNFILFLCFKQESLRKKIQAQVFKEAQAVQGKKKIDLYFIDTKLGKRS